MGTLILVTTVVSAGALRLAALRWLGPKPGASSVARPSVRRLAALY